MAFIGYPKSVLHISLIQAKEIGYILYVIMNIDLML